MADKHRCDALQIAAFRGILLMLKIAGIAVVLLLVYVGAYFALLEGKVYRLVGSDPSTRINRFEIEPQYRVGGDTTKSVLAPAHWIDCGVRREYWDTIEKKNGTKWKNPRPPS